jgi:hypothetical protein
VRRCPGGSFRAAELAGSILVFAAAGRAAAAGAGTGSATSVIQTFFFEKMKIQQ